MVSIHAPTWGATHQRFHCLKLCLFQSTRPRGARQRCCGNCHWFDNVSIHAPTWGATHLTGNDNGVRIVSIHAPTWGATMRRLRNEWAHLVSIHAPTWGATVVRALKHTIVGFQSTRPRGARQGAIRNIEQVSNVSIHAPTWGATSPCSSCITSSGFQSTRPRGARPHRCR